MKAAIYNPYWDTLGGGERYVASVAQVFLKTGYSVDIEWDDNELASLVKSRFGLDMSKAKVVDSVNRGDGYDACFWVSDGSIPTLKSRNNFLHFQVPFKNVSGRSLINKMKLFRIKRIICNSNFTKQIIDKEYGVNSAVIYPPVDVVKFKAKRKENIILYVGRFSQLTQSKNQHILVSAFKKYYDSGNKGWKMVLAGGAEVGAEKYLAKLRSISKSYPISFEVSPSFRKLVDLYAKSKVFWTASGYGINPANNPDKVEHFGITLVEAMAAKCIPFATQVGGHTEIIDEGANGFFWEIESELIRKTAKLVGDKKELSSISAAAKEKSSKYNLKIFEKEFSKLI